MIDADSRVSFYKSVSKFWKIYRKSNQINANIIFRLREVRTCLRKIEDDQSNIDNFVSVGSKFIETIYNVVQNEYVSALASITNALNVSKTYKTTFKCHI
jgi:LPS sulfotransferase NodH